MKVRVRLKPGSDERRVRLDEDAGLLDVWVRSRPIRGEANRELIEYLSEIFGDARIVNGHKSRMKTIEIPIKSLDEIPEKLA